MKAEDIKRIAEEALGADLSGVTLLDGENRIVEAYTESEPASHVIESLGLDKPVYAEMCRRGLFGYEA